jgi:hypothetical protein
VIPSMSTVIYADAFSGAQGYRFRLYNTSGYSQQVDRVLRTFSLNNFTGLVPAQTYSVKVSLKLNGVWGPEGKACAVTIPVSARLSATSFDQEIFKAAAYPNPFVSGFRLNVETSSSDRIELKVYDMIGKLIEVRQVNVSDMDNMEVGSNYPSGVYNMVITQGENLKTLRIIKR